MHPLLHLELNRIRTEELLAEAEAYRLARIARPVRPARPALRFSLGARPAPVVAPCTGSHA